MDALGDTRTENREINYVNDPVGKLYRRLLPSAIGSLLTATVASLIDVVILSYFLGPSMLAVVELCMPVYMLVNTLAMLISSGAATLYAHFLGEGDRKEALCWFSASTIHMLICGSVLMLAGLLPMFQTETVHSLVNYFIPFYNSIQVMADVFAHSLNWTALLITLGSNIVYTGIAIWGLTRMFNSEKVMFSR